MGRPMAGPTWSKCVDAVPLSFLSAVVHVLLQFDSLVQTATGFNIAEAQAFASFQGGSTQVSDVSPRPLPLQAIDHAAGYLLAFGINAALCKTITVRPQYIISVCNANVIDVRLRRREARGKSVSPSQPWANGSVL